MVPLDKLELRPASQAQLVESRRLTSVQWAKWYSLEEYLQCLEYLETLDHASEGKLIVWVLVPNDDPETLDILSTCQTYQRDILVLPPGKSEAFSDIGYGIASVFTPEKYRRKGYAMRMMSLLHFALAKPGGVPTFPSEWGKGLPLRVKHPGLVSVLYSGVGRYYSRCAPGGGTGWVIVGTTTSEWVVPDNPEEPDTGLKLHPEVELLSMQEAISAVTADAPLLKLDFGSLRPSSKFRLAFQPTAGWCQYQMIRDQGCPLYVASPPKIWGVRIQSGNETHFLVWTYRPRPDSARKLIVVSLRASPVTFRAMLSVIFYVARQEKHHLVEAWNLDEALVSVVRETGGRTYEREGQLPALKWYGPGEDTDVIWVGNNK